jgi:hypothetical protein
MAEKHDEIWNKALKDEAYREKLLANPVTELKKEGYPDVPDDLKVEIKDGKLTFSTSDELILGKLNARVTKSK